MVVVRTYMMISLSLGCLSIRIGRWYDRTYSYETTHASAALI